MKAKTLIQLIVTSLILFTLTVNLSAQLKFKDLVGHSVLTYGDEGEWDDSYVWNASIIKDGDTLRMWYHGSRGNFGEPDFSNIGYAWSLDGIEWSKHDENPVLSATLPWEGDWVDNPVVIKDGDTLKMWYTSMKRGYAKSVDGINWTKHPEPLELTEGPQSEWDDGLLWVNTVIKEDDGYKMWYSGGRLGFPGVESHPQVGFATSPDGIHWTKYDDPTSLNAPYALSDPVLKTGEENDWDLLRAFVPKVVKTDTGYTMFYTGVNEPPQVYIKQQIGMAYSTDGIHWIKDEHNPIIKDDKSVVAWGGGIYTGTAFYYDDRFHIWFGCENSQPFLVRPQIGYATQLRSCFPDNFEFTTQEEIDSFKADCNNCNVIEGNVTINGDDITNLNGLSVLTSIGDSLDISYNTSLTSLTGLDNLTSIGGNLEIYNNTALASLTGLDNLTSIGQNLYVYYNDSLTSLTGLDNLTSVGHTLYFYHNNSLTSLTGLDNLPSIGGSLVIDYNPVLTSLTGLDNLTSVGGGLTINENDSLASLTGLGNLTSAGGSLAIIENNSLASLTGLDNIDVNSIIKLYIISNSFLSNCDVQSICDYLVNPNGEIEIQDNAPGCNSVEEVEEDCNNNCLPGGFSPYNQEEIDNFKTVYAGCTEIRGNVNFSSSQITNLDSLDVLKSINGNLSISGCDNLTSLSGLDSLNYIGGNLSISYNSQLSICDVKGICNYVASPNGEISIHDNATDCNSITEVENACGFDFVIENGLFKLHKIHPNPFTTSTTLSYELKQPEKVSLSIYNHLGQQVYQTQENQPQGKQQIIWNADGFADGIYYYRLQVGDDAANGKMVKVR